jgi:glycerol uptake facilitator-like aquaporin
MVYATIVDKRAPKSVFGIAIGGTLGMSALGLAAISGGALNSMRWLGPWIVSLWANPDIVAKQSSWMFLPYLVFTNLGGVAAGLMYNYMFLVEE